MLMTDGPHPPVFSIVTPQEFLSSEQPTNTHNLPTNFIISLSYMPLNNTFLSLFSLLSYSQSQTTSDEQNPSPPPPATVQSEFMLSHSAAILHTDSYYDLWRNFSALSTGRYSLNLIVMNGRVGICMNGEYHPPMETIKLWENVQRTDSLEMIFSPYLSSIYSMVKTYTLFCVCMCVCVCVLKMYVSLKGIICSMKILPLPEDLPSSPFLCSLVYHACLVYTYIALKLELD